MCIIFFNNITFSLITTIQSEAEISYYVAIH